MAGIQPEHEQEQESHVVPSSEANPPSTPLSTIPPALPRDKTPATSCNLLSWFRHPLATFTASLKRRRCASSAGDNSSMAGRKKKAQILDDEAAAAAEAKARQEKAAPGSDPELLAESIPKTVGGATTTAHVVDCLNNDDDVCVKKEDMSIACKEEKAKAKEQQGSPENVVDKKWIGEPIDDITEGNNHKVSVTSPNKLPECALTMNEEAAAAHSAATAGDCWEMNQQLAAGLQDAAENAKEEAAPATEDTAVTAVSGIREIK